jgi:hypothetical protein
MIGVIIAVLTAWLLISDLHLWMFPWPGRVAIFLAIFAAVRWLIAASGTSAGAARKGRGRYRGGR